MAYVSLMFLLFFPIQAHAANIKVPGDAYFGVVATCFAVYPVSLGIRKLLQSKLVGHGFVFQD